MTWWISARLDALPFTALRELGHGGQYCSEHVRNTDLRRDQLRPRGADHSGKRVKHTNAAQMVFGHTQRLADDILIARMSEQHSDQRITKLASGGRIGIGGDNVATELIIFSEPRRESSSVTESLNTAAGIGASIDKPQHRLSRRRDCQRTTRRRILDRIAHESTVLSKEELTRNKPNCERKNRSRAVIYSDTPLTACQQTPRPSARPIAPGRRWHRRAPYRNELEWR